MKNIFKTTYFIAFTLLLFNCSKEYEVPSNLIEKDFVWKGLNAYYLYQDDIADLADTRFNSDEQLNTYLSSYPDYNSLFFSLLISDDTKSTIIEDYNTIVIPELRTGFTNGLEFGVFKEQDSDTIIGYALDVLPLSYASSQNIIRGDYFNAIINIDNDTINLTSNNYADLLINYTQDTLKLVMVDYVADIDGYNVTLKGEKTELVKKDYNYPSINKQNTFTDNGKKIGYIAYNNDFSSNYIEELNNTFLNLKNLSVTELILDLRYNIGGGGFAKNVTEIASMITGQFKDEVLIKEKWNTKAQNWFLLNQPDSISTKFPTKINTFTTINSLNLNDVYIILNGDNYIGSSATELLINSLKPYINVHVIGNLTAGNNTGAITLYNSPDYDFPLRNMTHTLAIQPVVLTFLNKDDETYENGLLPDIIPCDNEDALNLGVLGETSEPIIKSIIDYILNGSAVITNCNSTNLEYLYNSIETQKEIYKIEQPDNGMFIKQDLPNTNN
jgi:hypothetical protein